MRQEPDDASISDSLRANHVKPTIHTHPEKHQQTDKHVYNEILYSISHPIYIRSLPIYICVSFPEFFFIHQLMIIPSLLLCNKLPRIPPPTLLYGSAHTIHQQLTQYLHIWQSFQHFSQGGQWLLLFVFPLLLIVTRRPKASSIFTTRRPPSFPAKAALKSASTRMPCRSCSRATSIQTSCSQQRATGSCWWLIPVLKLWVPFNGHFPTLFKPRIPSFFSIFPNPPSLIVVSS